MRILLVEDNVRPRALVAQALQVQGFAVDPVGYTKDAEVAVLSTPYDALLLDFGLPDRDGITVEQTLRRRGIGMPVLVLTSRDSPEALVEGLNDGADDYLRKNFVMDDLIARVRALLRRPSHLLGVKIQIGNIELDTAERRVWVAGRDVDLSGRELCALEALMRRSGRVISKSELEDSLYGFNEEVSSSAVEVLLHRVRK